MGGELAQVRDPLVRRRPDIGLAGLGAWGRFEFGFRQVGRIADWFAGARVHGPGNPLQQPLSLRNVRGVSIVQWVQLHFLRRGDRDTVLVANLTGHGTNAA